VVVTVERVAPGPPAARLGALCAVGHGHGLVLGGTYDDADFAGNALGVLWSKQIIARSIYLPGVRRRS
jgi:hypothetical protein